MKKKLLIFASLAILSVLLYFIFFRETKDQSKDDSSSAIVTRMTNLRRGEIRVDVTATGSISPINIVEIKSKASGTIEKLPIEVSDPISRGQLIARLDQTDTRNAFEQALADSEVASAVMIQQENNFKRAKDLFDKGLMAQLDYDAANVDYVRSKSNLVKAQANMILTRQKLAETIVVSPVDGIVLSKAVSLGQIVSSAVSNAGGGTTIARIANMDEVYVIAAVDEVDIGKVEIGQKTKIVADAFPDERFFGKVIRIASQSTVIQNVTTFDVVIQVVNRDHKLKAGMNAAITITIAQKDHILVIDNDLLRDRSEIQTDLKILTQANIELPELKFGEGQNFRRRGEEGAKSEPKQKTKFVVLSENGRLSLKPITIGLSNFESSEVIDGLNDSSKVAYVRLSQVKKDSENFKERMKSRSGMGR